MCNNVDGLIQKSLIILLYGLGYGLIILLIRPEVISGGQG